MLAVRGFGLEPPTARRPSPERRHVGFGPEPAPGLIGGLVDEDQALGVEIGLPIEPGYASPGDVRSILFASMRRLFLSVTSWRWKNRQTMLR